MRWGIVYFLHCFPDVCFPQYNVLQSLSFFCLFLRCRAGGTGAADSLKEWNPLLQAEQVISGKSGQLLCLASPVCHSSEDYIQEWEGKWLFSTELLQGHTPREPASVPFPGHLLQCRKLPPQNVHSNATLCCQACFSLDNMNIQGMGPKQIQLSLQIGILSANRWKANPRHLAG